MNKPTPPPPSAIYYTIEHQLGEACRQVQAAKTQHDNARLAARDAHIQRYQEARRAIVNALRDFDAHIDNLTK